MRNLPIATKWAFAALSLAAAISAAVPARAMEVTCVEASRYKYIYRIFDNDQSRFAAFFGADAHRLPGPETCRAVVITGSIDPAKDDDRNSDIARLIDAIRQGGGWLSTVYLASPGGNIGMGLKLGELTRMFWLNTSAVQDGTFDYVPDFLSSQGPGSEADVPSYLQRGYAEFVAVTRSISHLQMTNSSSRRCASACTYMHAAGIFRAGTAFYHRGRSGRSSDGKDLSMTQVIEGLQKSENRIVAFYRTMDAGDEAIQAFQSTASETTLGAPVPTMPRYVGDFLKKQCGQQTHASSQRAFPAGSADVQCLSAANSRERLQQYGKFCTADCDHRVLIREAAQRANDLLPEQTSERRSSGFQRGSIR